MMNKQRKAFSLITAIFVMITMAGLTALVMGTAGKTVKETISQYQKEQAVLLAKSYTELAIMAVSANINRNGNCIDTINGSLVDGGGYTVSTEISYIFGTAIASNCSDILTNAVVTPESDVNIIIDIYVTYQDLDNVAGNDITYHRRTLQKI